MKIPPSLRLIIVFLLTGLSSPLFSKPNVVLIIADDAGYADFGFMDELTGRTTEIPTPNLDSLSLQGTKFSSAYTGSVCSPSRAAITTGFYQNRLGYEYNTNNLTSPTARDGHFPETVTIFEWMRHLGYRTGAIGKWHIGAMADNGMEPGNRPERQGVDKFFGLWGGSRQYQIGVVTREEQLLRRTEVAGDGTLSEEVLENKAPWTGGDLTEAFGQAAETFIGDEYDSIDGLGNAKPFFLYVAFTAPHGPLYNSPDYDDPRIADLPDGKRRQYASMMITMDKAIGGIVDRVEDPNGDGDTGDSVMENTLFIFINDNGGPTSNASSNYPLRGQKGNAEEGGIRVPMFITGQGVPADAIYDKPIHSIDIVPTVAKLAGATNETTVDGVSIGSLDGVDLRPYLSGSNLEPPHEVIVVRRDDRVGLRKGDWKLTVSNGTFELYNLAEDIRELNNLANAEPEIFADLIHELNIFDAHSDKPRHAPLDANPDAINLNDQFEAVPPVATGTVFIPDQVIVGGPTKNGDFNASAGSGNIVFSETDSWINLGTAGQSGTATNNNLDFDGTHNAILAKSDTRTFGLDTEYSLVGGELLHTSYQWRDALDWSNNSDRIAVTLFVTDNDLITGNRTVIEVALSRLSQVNTSYQAEEHVFNPIASEYAGKRLFVQLNPEVSGSGFARLDNFVLERGTVGEATEREFPWSESQRWLDAFTGEADTLLSTDPFPGAVLTFPIRGYDYTATNNMTRMTGLEFMLNKLIFTGDEPSTVTIDGLGLIFTNSLTDNPAIIEMNADSGTVQLQTDLVLFDDLIIGGTGTGMLEIGGGISNEWDPRQLTKRGGFTLRLKQSPAGSVGFIVEDGTLSLSADVEIVSASEVRIERGGQLSGTGRVFSPLVVAGSIAPGDSIGTLSVQDVNLSGSLDIEWDSGDSDLLQVGGSLSINGAELNVTDLGGTFPTSGITVATYASLEGEFVSVNGLPAGYHLEYAHPAGAGSLAIAILPNTAFDDWVREGTGLSGYQAALHADPNGDGVINGIAYLLGMPDPLTPAHDFLPELKVEEETLRYRFERRKNLTGLQSEMTGSVDFNQWDRLLDGTNGIQIEISDHPEDASMEQVLVEFPVDSEAVRFIRIEMSELL